MGAGPDVDDWPGVNVRPGLQVISEVSADFASKWLGQPISGREVLVVRES
jgi:hypothetical protein